MEQILNKISEIETTANYIMEEAAAKKQALTQEMEEQCRQFDEEVDADTAREVAKIRRQLEQDEERELAALRAETAAVFAKMEDYYSKNHDSLAQSLYNSILNR